MIILPYIVHQSSRGSSTGCNIGHGSSANDLYSSASEDEITDVCLDWQVPAEWAPHRLAPRIQLASAPTLLISQVTPKQVTLGKVISSFAWLWRAFQRTFSHCLCFPQPMKTMNLFEPGNLFYQSVCKTSSNSVWNASKSNIYHMWIMGIDKSHNF